MGFGKGKGKFKGFSPYDRSGPILEAPPLYPMEKMLSLPPAEMAIGREDCMLIESHRRLVAFWKTSQFYMNGMTESGSSVGGASSLFDFNPCAFDQGPITGGEAKVQTDLNAQMYEIIHSGGLSPAYFPGELCSRHQLKIRGKATTKSVLEAMRAREQKEGKQKKGDAKQPKDRDGDKNAGDPDLDDDAGGASEEEFGDDDYVAGHEDFEDGMGNDFDDDGGGDGDADY
eukprot:TRINITY_DN73833_c0_g1_i1.p1 TRINITY_DN73833_c0_g1~~TRINITY_DN73833_c0_g1_i1.p1  ORF type:complete len:229 (-),score=45.03 TRINITY_DN73833_c0_g1_i1:138-824(-)